MLSYEKPTIIDDKEISKQIHEVPLKVSTDLDFFKRSLTDPRFEISEIDHADVLWNRGQLFVDGIKEYVFSNDLFINQFPFEGCLVMKNKLAKTIQLNAQVPWHPLTFDLDRELPAVIGEYLRRKYAGDDNH